MKLTKLFAMVMLVGFLAMFAVGCSERVPPGYNGMVQTVDGYKGKILPPGKHECWGRDRMILWERAEVAMSEKLSILCKDDLNFAFDLKLRASLDANDPETVMYILDKQGSKIKWDGGTGLLTFDVVYGTYIRDPARAAARSIVSQYETTQIRENRKKIEAEIKDAVIEAVKGTPVKISYLASSNFDYPEIITKAVEQRRKREIEIQTEKANQAMELLKMDNRMALAQKRKAVRAAEAEADSVYMEILGKRLTKEYLEFKSIERDMVLYEKVGQGDKVIITNGNPVSPFVDTRSK
jgi:hypothetical protein